MSDINEQTKIVGEQVKNAGEQVKIVGEKAKEIAQKGIENIKNVDWKAKGEEAKVKLESVREKIVSTWKSGRKGKAICVACAVGLLWIGSCIFGGGSESFTNAVDNSLQSMLISSSSSQPGDAFRHEESPYIRILSVVDDGVIVCYVSGGGDLISNQFSEYAENLLQLTGRTMDKVIHCSTPIGGYVDGANLKSGVYVRDGTFTYTSRDGASNTIESYSQITDEDEIERYKKEIERKREQVKREKEEEQAAKLREEKAAGQKWIEESGVRKLYATKTSDIPQDEKLKRVFKVSRMFGIEERPPEELRKFLIEAFKDAKWDQTSRLYYAEKAIQLYRKESKKYSDDNSAYHTIFNHLCNELHDLKD